MIRRGLRGDRRGAIAFLFALTILPLLGMVGLAIDWGFTTMAKARMDLAADAAALAAATTSARVFSANGQDYIAQGQAAGVQWFNAQAGTTAGLSAGAPVVSVSRAGGVFSAQLTYRGAMATTLVRIFGFSTFAVGGTASATITVGGYSDIAMLLDVSSSMGIAATPAAMTQLATVVANSPLKSWDQNQACAFGCHWDKNSNDFYGLARKNNIPLRIDVLNQSVAGVISTLLAHTDQSLYRIGLYSFDAIFRTVYPLSGNIAGALTAQQAVTVPLADPNNEPDTNYPLAMTTMNGLIATSGDGSTAASPRKFLFFITDGVQDYMNGKTRILGLMDPAQCNALKAKGVTILVLYTQYIPITTNAFYNQKVAPIAPQIVPYLQGCASSLNYYFAATDPVAIAAAMQQMLQVATSAQGRFTQ